MIFDWRKNGEEIVGRRRLSDGDGWEAKRKWTQELALMRYASHDLGWGEAEARAFWESLPNGLCATFSRYPLKDVGPVFSALWAKARALGPLPRILPGILTEGDVAALNSLEAPLPVRRLWLREAIWIRSCEASGIPAIYDPGVESWLWSQANPGVPYKKAHASARKWALACGSPVSLSAPMPGRRPYCRLAWEPSGAELESLYPWECPERAYALLDKGTFACPECGARHERAPKAKTRLCPACQARHRRISETERKRKARSQADCPHE